MTHKGTVPLKTDRLKLRRFTLNDAGAMYKNWAGDSQVTEYLMWQPHEDAGASEEILRVWIPSYEKPDFYLWAIELDSIGEPIGSISVVSGDDAIRMVHIGYCIGRQWWRSGYTTEALRELVRFFFEEVGVNRIESRHDPKNPNSGRVMVKAGMRYEGIFRQADHNNNGLCDAAHYAILADDYFGRQERLYQQPRYARIQTRETAYLTGKPRGIFASVHRLMEAGKLTEEEKKLFLYIDHDWFQRELPNPPFYDDDTPGKPITWFKVPESAYMLDKLQPLMDMLERNQVSFDIVYTNRPGKIVYEDAWQVAVLDEKSGGE